MRLGSANTDTDVAIIAEIGNNHEGDMGVARELVHAAGEAGAHAVKFQAIDPLALVHPTETARIAQLERFRLTPDQFAELAEEANGLGMAFTCSPFSIEAVAWLSPLVAAFKVASGDNDFTALLRAVGASGKPVIVSGGMTAVEGLRRAQRTVLEAGAAEFAALHCVAAYPVAAEQARLATIPLLARELGCTVGFSDHTLGIEAAVLAAGLGARIIEKHFTLRHDFSDFRDHQLSAEPAELTALVVRAAEARAMRGEQREAEVVPEEEATATAARRGPVATRDLPAGHRLTADDVIFLRPAGALRASEDLEGATLAVGVAAGTPLAPEHLAR